MKRNYFKIFNIEEKFEIDEDLIEDKYLEFQRNFHPDKAGIDEIEKSIEINEGYEILLDDLRRGAHLLFLGGVNVENDSVAPKVDQACLMKAFEIQEDIESADTKRILEIKDEMKKEIKQLFLEFSNMIEKKNFEKAAQILMKVKYFSKTLKEIK